MAMTAREAAVVEPPVQRVDFLTPRVPIGTPFTARRPVTAVADSAVAVIAIAVADSAALDRARPRSNGFTGLPGRDSGGARFCSERAGAGCRLGAKSAPETVTSAVRPTARRRHLPPPHSQPKSETPTAPGPHPDRTTEQPLATAKGVAERTSEPELEGD